MNIGLLNVWYFILGVFGRWENDFQKWRNNCLYPQKYDLQLQNVINDIIFPSFFSVKFGRKVQYVNYLHELAQSMALEQIPIPKPVIE